MSYLLLCLFGRIENLKQSDEGVYICRAISPYGQAQDSAKLTIQGLLYHWTYTIYLYAYIYVVSFECICIAVCSFQGKIYCISSQYFEVMLNLYLSPPLRRVAFTQL